MSDQSVIGDPVGVSRRQPNAAYFVATQMSGTALAAGFSHENRCEEPVASAIPLKVSGIGRQPPGLLLGIVWKTEFANPTSGGSRPPARLETN